MPRVKRELAEDDTNALREPPAAKRAKTRSAEDKENVAEDLLKDETDKGKSPTGSPQEKCIAPTQSGARQEDTSERIDYHAKTNNKLRALMKDRSIYESWRINGFDECSYTGRYDWEHIKSLTREEMIAYLCKATINYEECTIDELNETLRRRHRSTIGRKVIKIERLRANDEVHHDTGSDSDELIFFVKLDCVNKFVPDLLAKQTAALKGDYSSFRTKELEDLLSQRKLPHKGPRATLLQRLQDDNTRRRKIPPCKDILKKIKSMEKERDELTRKLERETGWTTNAVLSYWSNRKDERPAEAAVREEPVHHFCDYDWKESHWAPRSERELRDICERREMPGNGPKAAMIKWLETGTVDYEDLYVNSLEQICKSEVCHIVV